ncbi:alpha/beta hydrolase [Desulfogranum japonicum]|uniref:alpha/beta hydrolase n=1 Tax=Desulfogranum japonicum TaxID=231447 RepID=UPI00040EA38C|nr:alpha/beta hydrolase [Desulfogranum japonicum]
MKFEFGLFLLMLCIVFLSMTGCSHIQKKLLFFPTHRPHNNSLTPWSLDGQIIGYSRQVDSPENVWLMLHGNGGQAADRLYAIPCFSERDSVFILEYPGYGEREGVPSKNAFNEAAKQAFLVLRNSYPATPVCVVAESIGSGPALSLAALEIKPEKYVLIVPFDILSSVAEDHFPAILVWLILQDNWNNIEALAQYDGPVDIYGAQADDIISVDHAKVLAASYADSNMVIIPGGHNDWSYEGKVTIRNP